MWQMSLCTTAVTMMCIVGTAQAHFVWVEYDGDGPARAYFGEWAEDVREQTGGALEGVESAPEDDDSAEEFPNLCKRKPCMTP